VAKPWKTLRVVVELKVPPGSPITEAALSQAVRDTLRDGDALSWPVTWTPKYTGPYSGPKVKSYSRVSAAERTKLGIRLWRFH
jgi:hypothetical protein